MKKLINKSLAILTLIAMAVTMSYANKSEAPILKGNNVQIYIYPVDYITIHSIVMGKQDGSCKTDIESLKTESGWYKRIQSLQLSWRDDRYSFSPYTCSPSNNQNNKYIIVLTTNLGSYVYEFDAAEEKYVVLPLIDYKK